MENFPGINPDFSSLAETPESSSDKKKKKADKKEKTPSLFERDKDVDKSKEKKKEAQEIPDDKLAKDEKQLVVSAREKEVDHELALAPPDTSAEKEALVAATFLAVLNEELPDAETIEQALDISEEKALDIAGLEAMDAEVTEEEISLSPVETNPTPAAESIAGPPEEDDDPTIPVAATSGGAASSPPPPIPPGVAGAGVPPSGLRGSGVPPFGGGPGVPTAPGFSGGNILPTTPNIVVNPLDNSLNERYAMRRGLLVGGLVGYMVGRRRGRIKTEKKLIPIQHKLEKEVADLQQKIAVREEKIRTTVREQIKAKPEKQQQIVERMKTLQDIKSKQPEKKAPEQTAAKQPERLGKFAMLAEREVPVPVKAPEILKDVGLMSTAELLAIADKIIIEQSTLKKFFEASRLDDEGLRRVIRAYLRGERYERTLTDNLITPEKFAVPEVMQNGGGIQGGGATPQDLSQTTGMYHGATIPAVPTTPSDSRFMPAAVPEIKHPVKSNNQARAIVTVVVAAAVAFLIIVRVI